MGLVKLVRQSGELLDLGAHIVTSADRFDYLVDEHGEHFRHRPDFAQPDTQPLLIYAFARTKDGGIYFEVMPWREVEKFRDLAQARSEDTTWHNWTDEMAKVRVLKRLCKRLPMSATARAAFVRNDARDAQLLAPVSEVIDPVSAINATIRETAASAASASLVATTLDAPTSQMTARTPSASREARTRRGGPPKDSEPQAATQPLTLTYAQIAERLNKAKDRAALAAATKLIETLADEDMRDELYEVAEQIDTELAAAARDGESPDETA